MKITHFGFQDLRTKWRLEEASFDPFNLLVGISGAGKTKILDALRQVCRLATDRDYKPGHIEWAIQFEERGQQYRWEGRTEPVSKDVFPVEAGSVPSLEDRVRPTEIAHEKIVENGGTIIVERAGDVFRFQGNTAPKLNRAVSAIVLLESEHKIAPMQRGFRRVFFSVAPALGVRVFGAEGGEIEGYLSYSKSLSKIPQGFDEFRSSLEHMGFRCVRTIRRCWPIASRKLSTPSSPSSRASSSASSLRSRTSESVARAASSLRAL
ncbi:MAG: hypothetical protein IT372_38010 [Polyangiaceae bacterium]|nr:hypothetical protein [Polyangiaceae bacterium]